MAELKSDRFIVEAGGHRFEPLIMADEIADRIGSMASEIKCEYANTNPLVLVMLNGAYTFAADLLRQFETALDIRFIKYTSYEGMNSAGQVVAHTGIPEEVRGRDVLIVEDIVDTGETMAKAKADVMGLGAKSCKIASLLSKPSRRKTQVDIDFLGFTIDNLFVVGFGLDLDGTCRNLRHIFYAID